MKVQFDNISESAASARSCQYEGHAPGSVYRPDPGTVKPTANSGPLPVKFSLEDLFTNSTGTFYNGSTSTTYQRGTCQSLYGERKAATACIMTGINDLFDMSQEGREQAPE